MRLKQSVENALADTKAGVGYHLHPGKREEEANRLYYGFNERASALRYTSKDTRKGVISGELTHDQGLVVIDRYPTSMAGRRLDYHRYGSRGGDTTDVTFDHIVQDGIESTQVTTNKTRVATSAGALRVAGDELKRMQEYGPEMFHE